MAEEIAKKIILSAAPGQFDAVAENVQKLAKDTLSGSAWLDNIKKAHAEYTCVGLTTDTSHPLASSLQEKLNAYQEKTFASKAGVTARVAVTKGSSSNELVVQTYAEKIDAANQYTGAWKATWTVVADSDKSASVSGTVKLHTYSYEDGNVQLRINQNFDSKSVSASNKDGLAQELVDQILAWEHDVLNLLAAHHDLVADNLRSIRRILPITKTRMKWDVVAHRNVKTLQVTAKR